MNNGLKLKLNVNFANQDAAPQPPTPLVTPGGTKPKFKLTNSSNPATPAPLVGDDPKPKKTKAGRATKPSAKVLESRKRIKEEVASDDGDESSIQVQPQPKKIKLNFGPKTPATPNAPVVLKAKRKGKLLPRSLGEGYDSEASEREIDPFLEEDFVLRMYPGEDCDYLKAGIAEKRIGLSPEVGGANVQMKFFDGVGRRAMVTVRGRRYAATIVDLPCIIEGMKSLDKRGWMKSVDICQMLWVFAPVKSEEAARTIPLPEIIDPQTHQFPHGLTPPMQYARKRRFRKRISRTAIEAVEVEVERLLAADELAANTKWEIVDPDAPSPREIGDDEDEYSGTDEDADGEADDTGYFGNAHAQLNGDNMEMEADLFAELEAAELEAAELKASMRAEYLAATPASALSAGSLDGNGTGHADEAEAEEDEATPKEDEAGVDEGDDRDESEDDEDDEEQEDAAIAERDKERLVNIQSLKEQIADLETRIAGQQNQIGTVSSIYLKKRLEGNVRRFKSELQASLASLADLEDG